MEIPADEGRTGAGTRQAPAPVPAEKPAGALGSRSQSWAGALESRRTCAGWAPSS